MSTEDMEKQIEAWAAENKERAKALGMRLIKFNGKPAELLAEPSLGEFEDRAQRWAINNQVKAKMLLMKLYKMFV